ncbi:hypothetical protein L6164_016427 [Bauhinia variegata]|uniref:Uncharacterized protein n=1 Tax=Bauhinia variegata TaxID=167791 RepID=A0ACB9NR16_BAUVA|nr:hypothetical protein L6164_016427 [Bauhinia variegata]
MDSLSSVQDLNLLPVTRGNMPSNSSGATANPNAVAVPTTKAAGKETLTPMLVPKAEPSDEPLATLSQEAFFSTPSANGFSYSPSSAFSSGDFTFSDTTGASPDEGNLYSEFCRISELFRAAFAKGKEQLGGEGTGLDSKTGAIVPVPEQSQNAPVVVSPKPKPRQKELVRVTDLRIADQRHFRDVMRRTRLIYDSLRVLATVEEERRSEFACQKRLRGDLRAASLMRNRGMWLNRDKRIVGSIPGIDIGDLFFFRMELVVVGLHGQAQAGIDYLPGSMSSNGQPIATSVIVSGGYEDDEDGGEEIVYTGHGGQDKYSRQCEHQKLEGGNLALERSMTYGIEVRVIRGIKYEGSVASKIYVYDGLYKIIDCWFDVGKSGFGVYKYKLMRIEGQPEMGSMILRRAAALRMNPYADKLPYVSLDLSNKRESVPVRLFNNIDSAYDPLRFEYLLRTTFPPFVISKNGTGCECVSGCTEGCLCAMKNGGEFAYNMSGFLVRGKPVIFECGPFCSCPPECRNRVTQKGFKHQLEVFRSRLTGWGVRSLNLIHAGSFICEYTGVVLTSEQAKILTMNGDKLIYPNRFPDRWADWGDVSQVFSDYVRPSFPTIPPLDFALDVSRMRNVACYMSHSSTPNVMVQFVLYDHNNLMFPHIMLFAMENIPPMRELSLDYGVVDDVKPKLAICN